MQIILQCFFGILESPVFKKKGLTKRLGDGFMAAFGFATPDNDFFELCKRCHECTRLIVKNLPKLNKQLSTRLPFFPEAGIKLRIGLSAGQASIGVVQTDAMSNADVYGFQSQLVLSFQIWWGCKSCTKNGRFGKVHGHFVG